MSETKWRDRAYAKYISSGQANNVEDLENAFSARKPYILSVIRHHFPSNRDTTILDLGCGSGAYLYFLKGLNYSDLSGVDVSIEQVALAHKLGLDTVICDSIESYLQSQPDSSIDVVLLMDVIEHMERQALFDLLDQVIRVLRPSGRCLLHIPNAEGIFGMRIRFGDITHELAFTPNSMSQILSLIGFEDIQCFEDKPLLYSVKGSLRRIIWEVGTLLPRLLLIAETGQTRFVLSQNMLVSAIKTRE